MAQNHGQVTLCIKRLLVTDESRDEWADYYDFTTDQDKISGPTGIAEY